MLTIRQYMSTTELRRTCPIVVVGPGSIGDVPAPEGVPVRTVDALEDSDLTRSRVGPHVGCVVVLDAPAIDDPLGLLAEVAERAPDVPTVFVTAADDEGVGRAIEAGADDIVHRDAPGAEYLLANAIERALETSERRRDARRHRSILERSPDAIIVHDADGEIVEVNEAACESLGYTRSELTASTIPDVEVGIEPAALEELWDGAFDRPVRLEGRHRRADGTEFPVEVHLDRIDVDGAERFVAIARDVTARFERERELRHLSAAIDASMDGIAVLDEAGRYVYLNDAHAQVYGYEEPEELRGERWSTLYDRDERARFEREILPEVDECGRWRGEAVGRRADGTTFDQELSLATLEGGGTVCVVRDVTSRTERLRRIADLERKYRTLIEAAPDAIVVADQQTGELLEVNAAAESLFGRPRADLLGRSQTTLHPPDERERYAEGFARSGDGVHRFDGDDQLYVVHESGGRVPVEISSASVELEGEAVVQGLFRDISERVERERRLEERTEALSVLNQVLRHDVRNDMTLVCGWADLLLEDADGEAAARLEAIRVAAEHTIDLTDDVRHLTAAVVEDEPHELRPVDPGRMLEAELETLRSAHDHVDVTLEGAIPDVRVEADELLSTVFGNVLKNAVKHNDTERPTVSVVATADETTFTVRITDNGPGVPDGLQADVFERGVKGLRSPGTGVGLFLVRALVDRYGGEVTLETADPEGTVVTIELRLA